MSAKITERIANTAGGACVALSIYCYLWTLYAIYLVLAP